MNSYQSPLSLYWTNTICRRTDTTIQYNYPLKKLYSKSPFLGIFLKLAFYKIYVQYPMCIYYNIFLYDSFSYASRYAGCRGSIHGGYITSSEQQRIELPFSTHGSPDTCIHHPPLSGDHLYSPRCTILEICKVFLPYCTRSYRVSFLENMEW